MKKLTSYGYSALFMLCLVLFFKPLSAKISLPAIIGENMVLQRGIKVPIWGWADPGEKITLVFQGKKFQASTGQNGKWFLKLDTYSKGGPFEMQISSAQNSITLKNIVIGDVWLASGQSNMEFGIQKEKSGEAAIANARDTMIRLFYVPMAFSINPKENIDPSAASRNGTWIVCSPEAMADPKFAWHGFSATGYYFAKEIRTHENTPVGMIGSYKGGTPAQAWISEQALATAPAFDTYINDHQKLLENLELAKQAYPSKVAEYREKLKNFDQNSSAPKPQAPLPPEGGFSAPSSLFNAMINPIIPYGIKGVIWYQGESNGDKLQQAIEYRNLFPRLIADWRKNWSLGNFPFLFVQLANFKKAPKKPAEGVWPWVREAQLKTLALQATGMAVITDIGDSADIHPTNKKDVGIRLSLAARKVAYGEQLVYSGPVFKQMKIKGKIIELSFDHTGTGLTGYRPGTQAMNELKGFAVAAADGQFAWAEAKIEGNKVLVMAKGIENPVAVRYNWADNPQGTLYNKEGLPASPFRTDDFKPEQ
ncbi:sialate O-acetylesterase [Pedobacter miscanthi]|uniref:Sialate O-acetylesterase n=1 Tax=Pedobacter miscanthi TaxID=2259170 RepID=A0A366LC85_9SPHI|nr:sialate O-acetylesterase [Pedobacter miscanthi]RBQ11390.1 sialate O-acetylesterase [Pedobacter miscanthi]